MSKQRTGHQGKSHPGAETSIPLSIIIPLSDDADKLSLCIESLQKIRKPFNKDYEVILPVKEEAATRKLLSGMQGLNGLLEKGVFRIFSVPHEAGAEDAVRIALENSNRENILLFEPDTIERSFNFDEFFHIPAEELGEDKIILPVFREQKLTFS